MRSGPGSRWRGDEYDQTAVYEILNELIEILFQWGDRKRKKLFTDKFYIRGLLPDQSPIYGKPWLENLGMISPVQK